MKTEKYIGFAEFFKDKNDESIILTFKDIENILSFRLPPSARKHKAYWYGETVNPFKKTFLQYGYKVGSVDLNNEVINFIKINDQKTKYLNKNPSVPKKNIEKIEDLILLDVPSNLTELQNDEYLMVKLNKENSLIIENSIDKDAKYKQKSYGLCMQLFRKNNDYSCESYFNVIKAISSENSTRTSNKNLEIIAKYLSNPENHFLEKLKNGNLELVDELAAYIKLNGKRSEKSLISKICKYLSQWLYDDAYTINDSVVRKVLPYYLAYYKIDRSLWENKDLDKISYVEFINIFDLVKEKVKVLTRHEIDHLLWYSYKNDPIRSSIASSLALYLNK